MAGAKLSPRQKMIGMMYLVLTALLALNVSKDILEAFVLVNNGLERTIENFNDKNEALYTSFDQAKSVDPEKVTPFWNKAQEARQHAKELVEYIEDIKVKLIMETDGLEPTVADTIGLEYVSKKDDYDTPTNIMIGDSEDGSAGLSRELKEKLHEYKGKLTNLLDEEDRYILDFELLTEGAVVDDVVMNWEMNNFYHTPLAASVVLLSKLQNDVKNVEYDVVSRLFKSFKKKEIPFDTVVAKVVAPSNYIMLGEEYKAEVFLAAYSRTQVPQIMLGDVGANNEVNNVTGTIPVEEGMGQYVVKTDREGIHEYSGTINLTLPTGEVERHPFKSEYIVARPAATVSATKMNVLYKGIKNPISVSVPGVPESRVKVSMTGGSLRRTGNGTYDATVSNSTRGRVKVVVSATMQDGTTRRMGEMEYRIKNLPKPFASTNNGLAGSAKSKKNSLAQIMRVQATYGKDFLFELPAPRIVSCSIGFQKGGRPMPDRKIRGGNVQEIISHVRKKLKPGDKIYLTEIKGKGADGIVHPLGPIIITVTN